MRGASIPHAEARTRRVAASSCRPTTAIFVAVWIVFVLVASIAAHEIPAHITVHMFAKPEGDTMRVLVRVPLDAIKDVSFPLRRDNPDLLDVGAAEQALRDSATQWVADFIQFYEDGQRLGLR